MQSPIIWIQCGTSSRLVHRFDGATPDSPVVVVTPDRREASDLAHEMRARQERRLRGSGTPFAETLEKRRPQWPR